MDPFIQAIDALKSRAHLTKLDVLRYAIALSALAVSIAGLIVAVIGT